MYLIDDFLDTALKQQRLPAWQPILTAKTVFPLFFGIGVIFVALGGVLLHFSDIVYLEYIMHLSGTFKNVMPINKGSRIQL